MKARVNNFRTLIPEGVKAIQALFQASEHPGVPALTAHLVHLRASQINGCGLCVDLHPKLARKDGETDQRLFAVAAWRDTPYFNDAERAALALTEAVTRLADQADPVPDAIWDEAARHYDEPALVSLLLHIASINVANRLNVATRQLAGSFEP